MTDFEEDAVLIVQLRTAELECKHRRLSFLTNLRLRDTSHPNTGDVEGSEAELHMGEVYFKPLNIVAK